MIFLGFIALIPAGLIAFLALSKKTTAPVRKISIIALIVIGLTFITCTIILVIMFGSPVGEAAGYSNLPIEPVQAEVKRDILPVIIASVLVLGFLIWIIILAIREQRRKAH